MRRRLALVTIAVTSLIIVSFVVPLGILARRQAADRALSVAERDAQSIATALAVTSSFTGSDIDGATATAVLGAFGAPHGAGIYLSDGSVVGVGFADDPDVTIARLGSAFTVRTDAGAAVLVPVLSGTTTTVVRVEVSTSELTEGVAWAWSILALLAGLLITIAIAAADRLGRSIVTPVADLEAAAAQLADGNLGARVIPSGPPEVVEVGRAFNDLADRLGGLLQAEREAAADLSHGLRTPLTALRLQVESLPPGSARDGLIEDVTLVEVAVDRVILEARTRTSEAPRQSDLAAAARDRSEFWEPLAVEQARAYATDITASSVIVHAARDEVITVLDTLIENVFAHTGPGAPIRISVSSDRVLRVEDGGPGFGSDAAVRGHSDTGSTGLGLDIVGRIAQRSGGEVRVDTSSLGGAAVIVTFGAASD